MHKKKRSQRKVMMFTWSYKSIFSHNLIHTSINIKDLCIKPLTFERFVNIFLSIHWEGGGCSKREQKNPSQWGRRELICSLNPLRCGIYGLSTGITIASIFYSSCYISWSFPLFCSYFLIMLGLFWTCFITSIPTNSLWCYFSLSSTQIILLSPKW